jgi:L-asparaginase/archaeal Glu-tRNAGln amidotransferase subunit D
MIVLLFTGGTISMRHDAVVGGAVPTLTGRDILAMAPGIDRWLRWRSTTGAHSQVRT